MILDTALIENFCENKAVLVSGKRYAQEQRVSEISFTDDLLCAKVKGITDNYEISVSFGDDEIKNVQCNCGRISGSVSICKHAVAALFAMEKEQNRENDDEYRNLCEDVAEGIVKTLTNIRLARNKKVLSFIPVIEIITEERGYVSVKLGIEIGDEKLYKVRKLDKLLECISENTAVEFSKNFVFNGKSQTFGDAENALVDYLQTVKQMYNDTGRTLPERYISLTGNMRISVFKLVSRCEHYRIRYDSKISEECKIYTDSLQIPLEFSKYDGKYKVEFEQWMNIKPISPDYRIVFYDDAVHVLSLEQAKVCKAFVEAGKTVNKTGIFFSDKDKDALVEHIMPRLRYLADLSVDNEIRKDIIITELKVKVFLETTKENDILAKVLFCYDDYEFNHFQGEKPDCKERVLLRDKRRENEFIRIAAKLGFILKNGYLLLNVPSKIYNFLETGLEKLSSVSEIFYSEDFYKLRVVMPSRANGSINIGAGDLFEFQLDIDDIPANELENVLEAVREKQHFYRLTNGNFVNLKSKALEVVGDILDNAEAKVSEEGTATIALSKALYIGTQEKSEILEIKRDKSFLEIIDKIKKPIDSSFEVPACLKDIMREYQVAGFKWLKTMAAYGFGGILADEMGLGKTLQTIAFIISEYEKSKTPALVVVPTSLLFNWQAEFEKFAPGYKVKIVYGTPEERRDILTETDDCIAVVTSYGLIRRDVKAYTQRKWSYCFIDEAQHIKNPNTVNAKAVKQIKADGYFAITGTPIENNLTELWSIFDFIMPGYLFSRAKYRRVYEIPIIKKNDKNVVSMLLEHTAPFILRRLKSAVMKELPEKIETYTVTDLETEQRELYAAYAYKAREEILKLTREKGFEKSRIEILARITRLRQLCCHPGLFVENYEGGSGKLNTLLEIVENGISSGRRILVFSQFTSMLEIIADMLRQMGVSYFYLDGSVKSSKRVEMCNAFNDGQRDVFLISLKAGGTGLNLVGADTVIHFDPWWNPAVENQATDRAHRIGQTKVVQVIKLVTKGTIEEKIQNLKEKKQELINSVLQEGTGNISAMTLEEIQSLFE